MRCPPPPPPFHAYLVALALVLLAGVLIGRASVDAQPHGWHCANAPYGTVVCKGK
jgi:hypothetical protein